MLADDEAGGGALNVLALDLGRTVGWARSDGRSGSRRFAEPDHGMALAMFSDWIDDILTETPLVLLAVERGFGGNNASGRLTTAMELTAHAAAWARQIPRTDRSANEVRKALLGFGRISPKVEPNATQRARDLDKLVLAAVRAQGFSAVNEHAADAAALLCCVQGIAA